MSKITPHEELRRSPEAYTIGFVAVIIGRAQLFIVQQWRPMLRSKLAVASKSMRSDDDPPIPIPPGEEPPPPVQEPPDKPVSDPDAPVREPGPTEPTRL